MKLLFITQATTPEDGVVGFVMDWIEESKKHFDGVIVFALRSSIKGTIIFKKSNRLMTLLKLNWLLYKYRNDYDVIFCHYSAIWACSIFIVARMLNKNINQWWAHGEKNIPLLISEKISVNIFTPSTYSNPINKSNKIIYTGHGIKSANFKKHINEKKDTFALVSVGRISRVKNIGVLVREFNELVRKDLSCDYCLTLIGPQLNSEDQSYYKNILSEVDECTQEKIKLISNVKNSEIYDHLQNYDGFINAQEAGGEGKAVLESMSIGLPTFFHTECYENNLQEKTKKILRFNINIVGSLASNVISYRELSILEKKIITRELINLADQNHNLERLWKKIGYEINK